VSVLRDAVAVRASAEHELKLSSYQKKKVNFINGLNLAEEIRDNIPLFLILVKH